MIWRNLNVRNSTIYRNLENLINNWENIWNIRNHKIQLVRILGGTRKNYFVAHAQNTFLSNYNSITLFEMFLWIYTNGLWQAELKLSLDVRPNLFADKNISGNIPSISCSVGPLFHNFDLHMRLFLCRP